MTWMFPVSWAGIPALAPRSGFLLLGRQQLRHFARSMWMPATRVADSLRRTQRADGSWANAENLVKEDDPLIASAFAVRALIAQP